MQNKTINVVKTVRGVSVSRYSCSEKSKIFIAMEQALGKYPRKRQTKTIMRKWTSTEKSIVLGLVLAISLGIQLSLSKNIFVKVHDIRVAGIANIHHHMIPVFKKNPSYIIFRVVTNDGKFRTSHEILAGIYQSSFTGVCFWAKVEFLNIVKSRWGSQGAVSSTTSSCRSPGSGSGVKSPKHFGLFTSRGQINSSK